MKSQTLRRWSAIHTWSSLVCTLFLLLLALTGLPLIFHHELEHLLGDAPVLREMPSGTPHLNLQQLVVKAEQHRPGEVMQYFGFDEDTPDGVVAITAATAGSDPNSSHTFMLDARTGEAVAMPAANGGLMMVLLRLHVDMFAGLPGKLLLAFMGLLFIVALVSGTVLYAPFMRRLRFASVRTDKSSRVRWIDLHNLIGIVTLTWALVVGVTGVISALSDLVIAAWRNDSLAAMVPATQLLSIAQQAAPGMRPDFIAFPGTRFSSEHHYAVFMNGATPLTSHLDSRRRASLVHGRHGPVATAALRRLRRTTDADPLGGAGPADHRRAAQWPVPVVGQAAQTAGGASMSHRSQSTRRIFAWPLVIAVLGGAGLFAALLGDGAWDALAWVGLGAPVFLAVRGLCAK